MMIMKPINQQQLNKAIGNSQKSTSKIRDYFNSTETLTHVINGQHTELPIPKWIHIKFKEAFLNKWQMTALPSTWIQGIGVLTADQIRNAVSRSILEGDGWPPSLSEFIKYGKDTGFDYDASFDRMINREPLNDVEHAAMVEVGVDCRTKLSEDKARKRWTQAVKKYEQRQQEGTLPDRKQKRIENTKPKVGCDWLAPDGKYYTHPAAYWYTQLNGETK